MNFNLTRYAFSFVVILPAFFSSLCAEVLIGADDPSINYYGRFDFSTPSQPKFNWSGCAVEAAFPGPSIGFNLQDGNSDYDVEIDGVQDTIIRTKSGVNHYTVSTKLSEESHTIRIIQRSENHWNASVFGGFYLADGKQLLNPPSKPQRKIEFIGDSYTVGYGNESTSRSCGSDQLRSTTNTNRSFATLIGRAFHSQYMILGWSGQGMVRNYGDSQKKSADPYPSYYNRTLGAIENPLWDFSKWIPDLVMVCLCTNDFSTTPYPDDTMFINAYHKFITTVLNNYGTTEILCVSTHTGPSDTLIRKIVDEETTKLGRQKIHYAAFPQSLDLTGCDWHLTTSDDIKTADTLIESIMKITGWDTIQSSSAISTNNPDHKSFSIKTGLLNGNLIVINAQSSVYPVEINITDIQGRLIIQKKLEQNGTVVWDISNVPSGIYLIGNRHQGWTRTFVKN